MTGYGVRHRVVEVRALHPERGPRPGGPGADPHAPPGSDEGARIPVGQPADLLDGAEDTGPGVRPVDAWHEQHPGLAGPGARGGLGGLDGGPHIGVVEVQRNNHSGQHDLVVERQHGQGERCDRRGLSSHDLPFGTQVELCRLNA